MRKLDFGSMLAVLIAAVINRSVLLMMNPFGIAYFAAAYMTASGRGFLFIASLAGMATVMPFKVLLKYTGVMLGITVIERILKLSHRKVPIWKISLCTGVLSATAGFAYSVGLGNLNTDGLLRMAVVSLLEGGAAFCLVFIFHKALGVICTKMPKEQLTNEEQLGTGILIAVSLYSLSGSTIERYSIVQAVVFFLLFYIGYRYGCGASAVAGACIGSVMAINSGNIAMLGYMCLAGVLAGAFREKGRIVCVITAMTAMGFLGYVGAEYLIELTTVRGILAGVLVFVLLPEKAFRKRLQVQKLPETSSMPYVDTGQVLSLQSPNNMDADVTRRRLKDFSRSFKKLSETFRESVVPRVDLSNDEIVEAFDELTQNVCAGCSRCELCWEREYSDTFQAANNILDFYSKNGSIRRGQLPIEFRQRCINIDGFITETGRVIELAKLNLNWRNRFMESRLAVAGQFLEVADIIDDFSETLDSTKTSEDSYAQVIKNKLSGKKMKVKEVSVIEKAGRGIHVYICAKMKRGRFVTAREICQVLKNIFHRDFVLGKGCRMVVSKEYMTYEFAEDTRFKIIEGVAARPVNDGTVSGDTYTTMHLENGQVVMSLSDGMGTGKEAHEESDYIIRLIEQLMDTGFGRRSAVRLINSLMFLKSDSGRFSTVDLGMVDLYSGKCDFVKMGAAASVILHNDSAEIVESAALPVGAFTEADYEEVTKQLANGDKIVMVSDGIINSIERLENRYKKDKLTERDVGCGPQYLRDYLMKIRSESPQEIADCVLSYASSDKENSNDDMTVLVCGIYENRQVG